MPTKALAKVTTMLHAGTRNGSQLTRMGFDAAAAPWPANALSRLTAKAAACLAICAVVCIQSHKRHKAHPLPAEIVQALVLLMVNMQHVIKLKGM